MKNSNLFNWEELEDDNGFFLGSERILRFLSGLIKKWDVEVLMILAAKEGTSGLHMHTLDSWKCTEAIISFL